jgi:hypothetical protein
VKTRRATIGMGLGLAALALGLGGCRNPEMSRVSVLNESRTAILFAAWPEETAIPGPSDEVRVEANQSRAVTIDHPGLIDPAIAVRIRPAGGDASMGAGDAFSVRMDAPGPFLLRVRGTGERLTVQRETDAGAGEPAVPADPHQRGIKDDIPRSNVRFP